MDGASNITSETPLLASSLVIKTTQLDGAKKSPSVGSKWQHVSNMFTGKAPEEQTESPKIKSIFNNAEVLERITRYWPKSRRAGARGTRGSTGIFSTRDPPTGEEVKFLEAAEYGNIPTVRKMLEEATTFSVNCVDFMGLNALQLAVGNEHLEVVEVLLKQPVMARIGDALLLSISKGYVRIAEIILNHPSFQVHDRLTRSPCEQRLMNQKERSRNALPSVPFYAASQTEHKRLCKDTDFYAYDEDGTRFSPDITPIILAAQCQEYEIVHELLIRGARIERPHNYRCTCEECDFRKKLDSFSYSLSRINAYKGLASPAYLSLSSVDPVLTALDLSHELQLLAEIEKEFKKEYRDLATQCNDFAERLLDLCHDTEEVEVILNGEDKTAKDSNKSAKPLKESSSVYKSTEPTLTSVSEHSTVGETYFTNNNNNNNVPTHHANHAGIAPRTSSMPQLKRLKTAIRYSVKGFVAHPNCQQQLLRLWQRNLSWLWQSPFYFKLIFAGGIALFMPALAFIYIFAPCTKTATLMKSPFCKFISHAMSYFQFLLLLVVNSSDRFEGDFVPSWFLVHQTKPYGRFTTFTWCEVIIMLYILGFLWNECHELFDEGFREYMFKLWNIIDFFMLSIFLSSYALRFISYFRANAGQEWWDKEYGENATLIRYNYQNKSLHMGDTFINRTIPDSVGYYAYTNAERKHWTGSDPQLISEALFSFGIVLSFSRIAYILPANEMFGPLQISLGRTVADIVKWIVIFFMIFGAFLLGLFNLYSYYVIPGAKASKTFTTLEETFITLFWSMFGLADYKGVEVNYPHPFTRLVGYQLYGAYNIISVIIMLNMLIAMINSSYSDVEKDADVEWKFARAKLWLSYFDDGKTLPVPYNIIPSPKSVCVITLRIYQFFKKLFQCKLFKRKHTERPPDYQDSSKQKKIGNIRETVSMSSFGVNATINKKHNGMKRSETVAESAKQWRGLSQKRKPETLTRYQIIMRRIVKRFVIRAQVEKDRDEVNEGELQEIKHDISSLRFELLENNASYAEQIDRIRCLLEAGAHTRPHQHQAAYSPPLNVHRDSEDEDKKESPQPRRQTSRSDEVTLQRRRTINSASKNDITPVVPDGLSRSKSLMWAKTRMSVLGESQESDTNEYGHLQTPKQSPTRNTLEISHAYDFRYADASPTAFVDSRTISSVSLEVPASSSSAQPQNKRRRSAFVPTTPRPPSSPRI